MYVQFIIIIVFNILKVHLSNTAVLPLFVKLVSMTRRRLTFSAMSNHVVHC